MFSLGDGFGPKTTVEEGGGGELTPTLWVNLTTGDDSRSKATVAASNGTLPWQTIGRAVWGSTNRASPSAAQAAAAGDVVSVAAGTYAASNTGARTRFDVLYNCANEGTAGNEIVFQADGLVTLTATSTTGPIIGADGRDYIAWDGFTINEANAPYCATGDSGVVVFFQSTGSRLSNCSIIGDDVTDGGGNHSCVRIEQTTDILIDNNYFEGGSNNGEQGDNDAQVLTYDVAGTIIEHNEFTLGGGAIFIKGDHDGDGFPSEDNIIRYNYIHDMGTVGAGYGIMMLASTRGLVHQNVIADIPDGFGGLIYSLGGGPVDDQWINNVFYNCDIGLVTRGSSQGYSGIVFYNNIMHTMRIHWGSFVFNSLGDIDCEHNVYFNNSGNFGDFGATSYANLAAFKSGTGEDQVSPAAISSNPTFTNAAAHNFHLNGGSPADNQGRAIGGIGGADGTTIDAGVYITGTEEIGIES